MVSWRTNIDREVRRGLGRWEKQSLIPNTKFGIILTINLISWLEMSLENWSMVEYKCVLSHKPMKQIVHVKKKKGKPFPGERMWKGPGITRRVYLSLAMDSNSDLLEILVPPDRACYIVKKNSKWFFLVKVNYLREFALQQGLHSHILSVF